MSAPYVPAGLDRGDGQYKAPYQLVEYSTTIFDTSLDDADREHRPLNADPMAPDQKRARDVATEVAGIMRAKGDHLVLTRRHVEGLGLTLPRLYRLNMFARNNAVSGHKLVGQEGIPLGEWQLASRLVHRAALSILLDVSAQNSHDAYQLAGLVAGALDTPPKGQGRRVAKGSPATSRRCSTASTSSTRPSDGCGTSGMTAWRRPSLPAATCSMSGIRASWWRAATTSFTAAPVLRLCRSSAATWAPRRPAALWWSYSRTRLASHIARTST